jgi:hypothetical protein
MGMETSIELRTAHFYLVLAPRPVGRARMNSFAARLALVGSVLVLDGGNSFDALSIARQVRRQTADLEAVLGRLRVARAFTCYQMVAMLCGLAGSELPGGPTAVLALDLLATFCDESVPLLERSRLLDQALAHLRRLSAAAPLAVSATAGSDEGADARLPLGHPARLAAPLPAMLARLEKAADHVLLFTAPQEDFVQGKFW